jgi:hypothetical protein
MTAVVPRTPSHTGAPPPQAPRPLPRTSHTGSTRGWRWALGALVLGSAGALRPLPTLGALLAVATLLLVIVAPRAIVTITALAVLFVRPIEHLVPIPAVGYVDEALVALCVIALPLRRVASRRRLRTLPGQWPFLGFLVCGLLSALVLHVPASIFLLGAFIISKGLLFGWAVAQVDWTERHLATMARIGVVVILFALVAAVANLAAPDAWKAVLSSDANASEARSFLPSLIGPFTHPIDFGQFMAYAFIAIATWRATVSRSTFTLVLMAATGLAALASARRTAAGSIAVAWLWLQGKLRSTRTYVALLACLPVAVVVLAAPLVEVVSLTYQDYASNANPEARTVLTIGSFHVATDYFPGGAGFGRFGSAVAGSNYSPEYVARGYTTVWGLGRTAEEGRFLTDTEWPAIIGETGFLGAVAFAFGLVGIYRAGVRLWRGARPPLVRWAGLMVAGWLVTSVVQSVATVTFTGPPVYGLLFGLVGVVAALADRPAPRPRGAPVRTGAR